MSSGNKYHRRIHGPTAAVRSRWTCTRCRFATVEEALAAWDARKEPQ